MLTHPAALWSFYLTVEQDKGERSLSFVPTPVGSYEARQKELAHLVPGILPIPSPYLTKIRRGDRVCRLFPSSISASCLIVAEANIQTLERRRMLAHPAALRWFNWRLGRVPPCGSAPVLQVSRWWRRNGSCRNRA